MRHRIHDNQDRFFVPQIIKQETLQFGAVFHRLITIRTLAPIHGEVAIDDAYAVINDIIGGR